MRKIEEKIIRVMRECLDGGGSPGVYTLSERDRIEFTGGEVKYFLWGSNIFKAARCTDHTRFEFSDNAYDTYTTRSRLKALVAEFIAPHNVRLCVRHGYICDNLGRKLYSLSAGNCVKFYGE